MSDLDRAVRTVVRDCLVVREGEDVLVVANPATQTIGERLRDEAQDAGGDSVLAVMSDRAQHGAEPPVAVAAAMREADVIIVPTVQSLSHTAARRVATDAGARAATLPGVTEEMLARVMSADMGEIRRRGRAVADILTAGSEARITCPNGSDLVLSLDGRTGIPDAGELSEPGALGTCHAARGSSLHGTTPGTAVWSWTASSARSGFRSRRPRSRSRKESSSRQQAPTAGS